MRRLLQSFQVRIAALSMLISGCALSLFGIGLYEYVQQINRQRLDHELRSMAQPHLGFPREQDYWRYVDDSLQFIWSEEGHNSYILLVRARGGESIYQSANWPLSLDPAKFPPGPLPPQPRNPPGLTGPGPEQGPRTKAGPKPEQGPFRDRGMGPGGQGLPHGQPPGGENFRPFDRPGRPGPPFGPGRRPGQVPGPPPFALSTDVPFTFAADGQAWRVRAVHNPEVTVVIGANLSRYNEAAMRLRRAFAIALPLALGLVAAGSWWLARRALRPVTALTATIDQITAKGLDQRIGERGSDWEFKRLIAVFNGMLDRLEKSFAQATRFSADAAHELKTPLAILQGALEQAVQDAPPGSVEQRTYGDLMTEVQRLKTITRKLLLLSLADAGRLTLTREPVELKALLEELSEDTRILAPQLKTIVDAPAEVRVEADIDLLNQVLQNLVDNAIKYNRANGWIRMTLRARDQYAIVQIANTGKPIPEEDRARLFERFYRADKSRTRAIDGAGLGLSLSREIMRAHGGELVLEKSTEEATAFCLRLKTVTRTT